MGRELVARRQTHRLHFHPDFSETRGGGLSQIYVMNADGSDPINLFQDDYLNTYSTWSPDGRWLAFVSDRSGNWDIWKLDVQACSEARGEGVKGEDHAVSPSSLPIIRMMTSIPAGRRMAAVSPSRADARRSATSM